MATQTTRITVILLLLTAALLLPLLQDAEAATSAPPVFAGDADEAAYRWTQDLFSARGFEFPTVAIAFHRTDEECGGMRGRTHLTDGDVTATIHICAIHPTQSVEDAWRRRTLLHEVAHAWIDQNTSNERVDAFMALRDTDTWSGRNQAWQDRGAEHAAETFMWGIQEGDYNPDFRIGNTDCSNLTTGYELLTDKAVSCPEPAA
jgi:hypothetical protein